MERLYRLLRAFCGLVEVVGLTSERNKQVPHEICLTESKMCHTQRMKRRVVVGQRILALQRWLPGMIVKERFKLERQGSVVPQNWICPK